MNKRKLFLVLFICVCVVAFLCLNEIKSFDGYYRSIDNVIAHEEEFKKGAKEIALIENGSGYVEIMYLEDTLIFYSFKSKNSITGKKYAVAHTATKTIDYNAITNTYPKVAEWNVFSAIFLNKSDEKDMQWYIVEKTNDLIIEKDIMCFEYSHQGTTYCLLCSFSSD